MTTLKHKFPLLIILLLPILAGCGLGSAQVGRKPSPDWSRGIPLSSNVGGTIGMIVEGAGTSVHFVWPTADDDLAHIHYLQLDDEATPVVDIDLPLPEGRQRTPRLLFASDNRLHLFWASRVSGSTGWVLLHTLLDDSGNLVGEPAPVTPAEMNVGDYSVAQNLVGDAFIVWEDGKTSSIFGTRVTGSNVGSQQKLLVESGQSPGVYVDEGGSLHLAWFNGPSLQYAEFPDGELAVTRGTELVQLEEITATLNGPIVGVTSNWVYIIWSIFARGGMQSGNGWTEYISFPVGEPTPTTTERVGLLTDEEQPYEVYSGAYPLTVQAPPISNPAISSNYVVEPDGGASQGEELAVAISTVQDFRLDELVQMGLLLFKEGDFSGYQMAGKTESFSQDGSLFTDLDGNLHLAWLEGSGRKIYYASTAPAIKGGLDRVGADDLANALLGGGMEAVTGILFFPFALIWFIPGGIILAIWKLRNDSEMASEPSSRILLFVAILSYLGMKTLFLPSVISYVPFSAWIDVPEGLGNILRVAVPILMFAVGILVAELFRRRRPAMSSLLYFFILCGVDALLTLAVYGVNYLGVF